MAQPIPNIAEKPILMEAKVGEVKDYISGITIKATPEEIDAVQVFSQRLVEDFGYLKSQIQTKPQFRVRKSPSDEVGKYPVDIAVFKSNSKIEDQLYIIIECKAKTRKDGIGQLKRYLELSPAQIGVWFNGNDYAYIRKTVVSGGIVFEELPTIPRAGQRVEDLGKFRRRDLRMPSNLKAVFRSLRNNLAPNLTGITRDHTIAQEVINLLFCKIYDEIDTGHDDFVKFRRGVNEPDAAVKDRIIKIFEKVKAQYSDVFKPHEQIEFDERSLANIVGELQNYCLMDADRDAIGDAFEVFIGPAIAGNEGQFFTPRNAVKMIISIIGPRPGEMIIDPACGSGGFLIMALDYIWKQTAIEAEKKGWTAVQLDRKKREVASKCFRGIDKDGFLAKVTKAYMAIIGDGRGGIFCENSLLPLSDWRQDAQTRISLNMFDVVVTNPPFGKKMKITGGHILGQYSIAKRWTLNKKNEDYIIESDYHSDRPPQLLFIERCMQFLKPDGRLGIIIPESIIGNPTFSHVIAYIRQCATIKAVITLPEALFKTSGKGGTHTKVCALILQKGPTHAAHDIFMADVKWCGHDSRSNPTYRRNPITGEKKLLDEIPEVAQRYADIMEGRKYIPDHRGYLLSSSMIYNNILVPKFYNPEIIAHLGRLKETHNLICLGDLINEEVIKVITGIEVGKMAYGTGKIPFIRTSDLVNWEIKADFKHGVSQEIYDENTKKANVKAGDILMVRDGTYLIGTTAIVSESDLPMLFQSHILRFRVIKPDKINPWLLFACLNAPVVQRQIRSKQFTQDIIDTIGGRWKDLILPIPKHLGHCESIVKETKYNVETRAALRNRTKEISIEVEGRNSIDLTLEEDEIL